MWQHFKYLEICMYALLQRVDVAKIASVLFLSLQHLICDDHFSKASHWFTQEARRLRVCRVKLADNLSFANNVLHILKKTFVSFSVKFRQQLLRGWATERFYRHFCRYFAELISNYARNDSWSRDLVRASIGTQRCKAFTSLTTHGCHLYPSVSQFHPDIFSTGTQHVSVAS